MREYNIFFLANIPSYDDIIRRLRKNTGLESIVFNGGLIYCDILDSSLEIRGLLSEGRFFFLTTNTRTHYLEGSLLFASVELGGTHDDILPEWAGKKWEEIPDNLKSQIK